MYPDRWSGEPGVSCDLSTLDKSVISSQEDSDYQLESVEPAPYFLIVVIRRTCDLHSFTLCHRLRNNNHLYNYDHQKNELGSVNDVEERLDLSREILEQVNFGR